MKAEEEEAEAKERRAGKLQVHESLVEAALQVAHSVDPGGELRSYMAGEGEGPDHWVSVHRVTAKVSLALLAAFAARVRIAAQGKPSIYLGDRQASMVVTVAGRDRASPDPPPPRKRKADTVAERV